MLIAVGGLAWNLPKATAQWIDSTRRNSAGHEIKILAIDNGSTDDGATWNEVQRADWFERNETNENLSKGYNRLLQRSLDMEADIVCLANNDIIVAPRWLDAVMREFAVGDKRYFLPHEGVLKSCESVDRDAVELLKKIKPEVVQGRSGTCMFFTAEAVRLFLPIPEELVLWYCDSWIHHHLGKAGYRCDVVLDSLIFHYGSVSFYKRAGYVDIVARDRIVYNRLTGDNL